MAKSQQEHFSFTISNNLLQRAEASEAWATTRFKNYSQFEGHYPFYATHAKGAYVWDVDGNKYLDYLLGYGTIILGHADSRVNNAVIKELKTGINLSPLWKPLQIELTELLAKTIPGGEMAYLMKSGSDATSGAIRLARVYTGRNKIIRWGYHGWHDWATAVPGGIPAHIKDDILNFTYNDIDSLKKVFTEHPSEIAAVIMMPFEIEKPLPNFLEQVKELAHKNGALFILDEMRSGFRIALGGAQEFFNIKADLSTFSKAIANGYAISAIVGKREIMLAMKDTQMAATFYANTPEMAAAKKTIEILRDTNTLEHIEQMGEYLSQEIEKLIAELKVPAKFVGYPQFPFLEFTIIDTKLKEKVKERFFTTAVNKGIFLHPNHHWYISAAHKKQDINYTVKVFREAFAEVLELL